MKTRAGLVFHGLSLNSAHDGAVPSTLRNEFRSAMMECDRHIQHKIREFDADLSIRHQTRLNQLQSKEAQQSALLKQFDTAAKVEKAWNAIVSAMQGLTQNRTDFPLSLKKKIDQHFQYASIKNSTVEAISVAFQRDLLSLEGVTINDLQEAVFYLQDLNISILPDLQSLIKLILHLDQEMTEAISKGLAALREDRKDGLARIDQATNELQRLLQSAQAHYLSNYKEAQSVLQRLTRHFELLQERIEQEELNSKAIQEALRGKLALFPFLKVQSKQLEEAESLYREHSGSSSKKEDQVVRKLLSQPARLLDLVPELRAMLPPAAPAVPSSSSSAGPIDPSKAVTKIPLRAVVQGVALVVKALQGDDHLSVAISFLQDLLQVVAKVENDYYHQLYAAWVAGILYLLPESRRKAWWKLLTASLAPCDWTRPQLILPSTTATSTATEATGAASHSRAVSWTTNEKMAIFRFYAALLSYSDNHQHHTSAAAPSIFSSQLSWQWLVQFAHQFAYIVYLHVNHLPVTGLPSPHLLAMLLSTFLRHNALLLFLLYQDHFTKLLDQLHRLMTDLIDATKSKSSAVASHHLDRCRDQLALLHSEKIAKGYYLNHQDPFVLSGLLVIQPIQEVFEEVSVWEQDKASAFMQRVKAHQMDRLRAIFNRLSVTKESQTAAIGQLLEKIVLSAQDSKEMTKYILTKIAVNVLRDCQEEFFNEMDEGQPMRLAKLIVGMCHEVSALKEYFLGNFYRVCPILLPMIVPEGLGQSDLVLSSLGFIKKAGSDAWESNDAWLARMSKILAVFAVTAIQPEQSPVQLSHLWAYITRLSNLYAGMTTPPFFAASFLEVVLRIAAQQLFTVYKTPFMGCLVIIQKAIVPKLEENMPRKKSLETFLSRFISSNGRDFMSLFLKQED